ncbi:MAG: hypothetical protein WCD07_12470 [Burkholderiales bacterium]
MSQVNVNGKKRHEGTLFFVIGAQSVECGFKTGTGHRGSWLKTAFYNIPLKLSPNIDLPFRSIEGALDELGLLLSQRRTEQNRGQLIIRRLRVVIGDQWLAVTTLPWSRSVKDAGSADSYARSQLAAAGFAVDSSDTVRLDEAGFGKPRLAVSYPAILVQIILSWGKKLEAANISILPMSSVIWSGVRRQQPGDMAAMALVHEGMTMIMRADGQADRRMQEVVVRNTNSHLSTSLLSLREQWQRTRIRDQRVSPSQRLPVFNLGRENVSLAEADNELAEIRLSNFDRHLVIPLSLQIAELSQNVRMPLEALPQADSNSLLKTMLSLVAAGFAGVMIFQAGQTQSQLHSIESRLESKSEPAQQINKISLNREELARVPAINKAIGELNMPISALLRALNPPRDIKVAILSLETTGAGQAKDGKQATVKIHAEALSDADMTRFVAYVAERQPFVGAYLTRHEIIESLPEKPYRFTVEAIWLD